MVKRWLGQSLLLTWPQIRLWIPLEVCVGIIQVSPIFTLPQIRAQVWPSVCNRHSRNAPYFTTWPQIQQLLHAGAPQCCHWIRAQVWPCREYRITTPYHCWFSLPSFLSAWPQISKPPRTYLSAFWYPQRSGLKFVACTLFYSSLESYIQQNALQYNFQLLRVYYRTF